MFLVLSASIGVGRKCRLYHEVFYLLKQQFLTFLFIAEGTTKKILQFIIPLEPFSGWPDWAKFRHLGVFLWHWANFFLEKIAQWFGQNFSHEKIAQNWPQ
jgi:hypothetical protein